MFLTTKSSWMTAPKSVFFDNGWRKKKTPTTVEPQMTFILIGKGLVLEASKIEVIWALGSRHEQPG